MSFLSDQKIDEGIQVVIQSLKNRFGRWPTEEEIYVFIMGTKEDRAEIWKNKGLNGK